MKKEEKRWLAPAAAAAKTAMCIAFVCVCFDETPGTQAGALFWTLKTLALLTMVAAWFTLRHIEGKRKEASR